MSVNNLQPCPWLPGYIASSTPHACMIYIYRDGTRAEIDEWPQRTKTILTGADLETTIAKCEDRLQTKIYWLRREE